MIRSMANDLNHRQLAMAAVYVLALHWFIEKLKAMHLICH